MIGLHAWESLKIPGCVNRSAMEAIHLTFLPKQAL
jgi:hypothetical protein